ncbi:diaminobutyrate acetyltransferase [Streptomyces sp. NPDC054904]|uniref:diaminobutyrate acetyltransferase n=1 Tax=Streptomyces sp. Isolate_45 TaxID=2950111 RepID=UPI002481ACDB|nr:diaminobutyrate acetyltransferase [Streptomyces sp. Isolate_45]MDA5279782.1 diaminobutyrate acetyltransferase [Streptomyces sp. Isolate_45]
MTAVHADPATRPRPPAPTAPPGIRAERPDVSDGPDLWRIAREAQTLDVNSPYSYLLWCRDFAATSAVARDRTGRPVGFVTGYLRPDAPGTLLIWQVAVDATARGQGIAGYLLDHLTERVAAEHALDVLETTISPGNTASERLFASYAERHGARVARKVLFAEEHFPGGAGQHDAEVLHRIGTPGEPLTT